MVSCGAKHSLYNVFQAVVNPGDEILIPAPYWVSYSDMALLGGRRSQTHSDQRIHRFSHHSRTTRGGADRQNKSLCSRTVPVTPPAPATTSDELLAIARVLEKHSCLVIADDIYEKIVYDDFQVHNIVALNPALRDRTVIINGVSKTYAMTGWRIGYAIGPADIISAAAKIQSQSTSNPTSIAQAAAFEAISGPQDEVDTMVREFQTNDAMSSSIDSTRYRQSVVSNRRGHSTFFRTSVAFLGRTANGKKLDFPLRLCRLPPRRSQSCRRPG